VVAEIHPVVAAECDGWRLEPALTISEWADQFRILSAVSSSEPGRWRTSRTPYLREPMDALTPSHPAERVVVMKGAQIGGTELGNNWIGYTIHYSPVPMMMVLPTLDMARKQSKQRIAPMLAGTPELRDRVKDPRSRDSGNTVLMKEFEGGILIMAGSNSASGLRALPIARMFFDETDGYEGDVGGEGDPIALAEKRMSTFVRKKSFYNSTPTIRGISRIEREFMRSDQRRYFIPCPHCGHMDFLQWSPGGYYGTEGEHHSIHFADRDPETAAMLCSGCKRLVSEKYKTKMLAAGEWRPTSEGDGRTIGYHISSLYSPLGWKSWAQCVDEFLDAKNDPFKLKTWVNTVLGETWEERGTSVEPHVLRARCENYPAQIPHGVGVLVASVDVQGDRLEVLTKGYGAGERSWIVAFQQIYGDPASAKTWADLTEYLATPLKHEGGRSFAVERVVIDSGGAHTQRVYEYCAARQGLSPIMFAIKGASYSGKPLVERPTTHNRFRLPLFMLCVDTGKEVVLARLQIADRDSAGYMHFPIADWLDDEYFEQLTAEKAIRKYVKGRGAVREWVKIRERNEALDLEVYALAALYIMGPQFIRALGDRARLWGAAPDAIEGPAGGPAPAAPAGPPRPIRRPGWVNRW
jgi:phage terminase large subunit GpA-like protein